MTIFSFLFFSFFFVKVADLNGSAVMIKATYFKNKKEAFPSANFAFLSNIFFIFRPFSLTNVRADWKLWEGVWHFFIYFGIRRGEGRSVLSVELFEVIIQKRSIHHGWWVKCQKKEDYWLDTHETLGGTWDAHDSNWNVSFPRPAKQGGNPSLPKYLQITLLQCKSPAKSKVKEFYSRCAKGR